MDTIAFKYWAFLTQIKKANYEDDQLIFFQVSLRKLKQNSSFL